jgi:glycosyltransferase involved in cell wall biosynthesis
VRPGDPLRIGVDARELLGHPTGVGRYLAELLTRWTARADASRRRFVLFSPEALPLRFPPGTVDLRIAGRGRGTWWEQTALRRAAAREPLDLFFAPAYTAPVGLRVPLAVTVHDISFVAHPGWFRWREGTRRRLLTRYAVRTAAVVLTDSAFSRSEIVRRLQAPAGRLRVIPPGVAARQAAPAGPRDPLVLFVGSIFNRRRVPDLIAAFAALAGDVSGARLAIVGENRTWPHEDLPAVAKRHGVADRVEFRSYVDEATRDRFYARARVFAFLSEYEGFGLTPLEALAAGVPAVLLDTPVAREVCGPAAVYVRPGDLGGTTAALRRLLTDPLAAAALLAHAPAVLARYSWDEAASETLDALEEAARRS